MSPYLYLSKVLSPNESLLSLCCGIGLELQYVTNQNVTGVDITPEYLTKLSESYPHVKTICEDVLTFIKKQSDNSFDVISFLDGLEHLEKEKGYKVLKECKRVARNKIVLFTPEGYIHNTPISSWGVVSEIGDHVQHHLSGWIPDELIKEGFKLVHQYPAVSVMGEDYNESTYLYENT